MTSRALPPTMKSTGLRHSKPLTRKRRRRMTLSPPIQIWRNSREDLMPPSRRRGDSRQNTVHFPKKRVRKAVNYILSKRAIQSLKRTEIRPMKARRLPPLLRSTAPHSTTILSTPLFFYTQGSRTQLKKSLRRRIRNVSSLREGLKAVCLRS